MEKLRSLLPQIGSSNESDSSTSQRQQRALYASERARLLFGQFRKGDANDPDIYVATVAAILSDYPMETIRYVTDPRSGIAANPLVDPETGRVWTGMPDAANVKRACELHYGPTRRLQEREAAIRTQLAERNQLMIEDKRPRKTYAQIQAELAEVGIFIGNGGIKGAVNTDEIRERHRISKEDWDKIPSRKSA